jgi:hypothetical protein
MQMRKFLALAAVTMMTATGAMAQKSQPAGMRVEVCDAETDHGEYSIFTYQDTLSWVDFTSDDFKDEEEVENRTKCHVYDEAA